MTTTERSWATREYSWREIFGRLPGVGVPAFQRGTV